MNHQNLQNLGLTKTQSNALECLFEMGEMKAKDLAKACRMPRGVAYKALEELLELNLVEKREKEKEVARWRAAHPENLERIFEEKEKALTRDKKSFSELLPELVSKYNLNIGKPGVKFFEGQEGLEKVLYDTLSSKTEIYLMLNREAMAEEDIFEEINEEYKRKRLKSGVTKKILRIGTRPELTFGTANDRYDAITEIKYLEKSAFPTKTNIHIYDGKISFLIMEKGKIISILIENQNIFELNKFWFETLWDLAKK